MLDVEVIAAVAPGAKQRVYFAPNTDRGFLDAIKQACAECQYVSISWGGPESSWPKGLCCGSTPRCSPRRAPVA
jgi:kumamolisin